MDQSLELIKFVVLPILALICLFTINSRLVSRRFKKLKPIEQQSVRKQQKFNTGVFVVSALIGYLTKSIGAFLIVLGTGMILSTIVFWYAPKAETEGGFFVFGENKTVFLIYQAIIGLGLLFFGLIILTQQH